MGPPRSNCITEGQHLRFNRNVGNECQDFARVSVGRADGDRFSKIVFHNIACRDVATIGRELADKFATHASASAGDDSDSSGESFFKTFSHGFPRCVVEKTIIHQLRLWMGRWGKKHFEQVFPAYGFFRPRC